MNWGKGIIAGMIAFMLFILSMCIYMFTLPGDDYDHQYYEKGLAFNHDYDRERLVFKDNAQPIIKINDHAMNMIFRHPAFGTVTFLRPSNQNIDRVFKIDSHAGPLVNLPLTSLNKGKWRLIIDWESDHKAYLYQQDIYIP